MYSHPVVSMYIASFDLSMRCPVGIVIDEDGFVYVCNYSSNGKFFLYFEMALIFLALMALIILYFEMALMSTRYFQLSYLCI